MFKRIIFLAIIGMFFIFCEDEEKEVVKKKVVVQEQVAQEQVVQPQVVTQPVVVQQQDNFLRDMLLINALSNTHTREVRYVDRSFESRPTKNTTIIKNYNINKSTNVSNKTMVRKTTNVSAPRITNIRPKTTVHKASYTPRPVRPVRSVRVGVR